MDDRERLSGHDKWLLVGDSLRIQRRSLCCPYLCQRTTSNNSRRLSLRTIKIAVINNTSIIKANCLFTWLWVSTHVAMSLTWKHTTKTLHFTLGFRQNKRARDSPRSRGSGNGASAGLVNTQNFRGNLSLVFCLKRYRGFGPNSTYLHLSWCG